MIQTQQDFCGAALATSPGTGTATRKCGHGHHERASHRPSQ
jgi:hypothetical protein